MTAAELLRGAAVRLQRGWCQKYEAIDANGQPVLATRHDAVAWCAYGALIAVSYAPMSTRSPAFDSAEDFINMAMDDIGNPSKLSYRLWNDHETTTQAEIVGLFERAATLAEEAGA